MESTCLEFVVKNNCESPYRYFYKISYHKDHSAILLLFTFEAGAFTRNALILTNDIGYGCFSEARKDVYEGVIALISIP